MLIIFNKKKLSQTKLLSSFYRLIFHLLCFSKLYESIFVETRIYNKTQFNRGLSNNLPENGDLSASQSWQQLVSELFLDLLQGFFFQRPHQPSSSSSGIQTLSSTQQPFPARDDFHGKSWCWCSGPRSLLRRLLVSWSWSTLLQKA